MTTTAYLLVDEFLQAVWHASRTQWQEPWQTRIIALRRLILARMAVTPEPDGDPWAWLDALQVRLEAEVAASAHTLPPVRIGVGEAVRCAPQPTGLEVALDAPDHPVQQEPRPTRSPRM
jgi:hypothetical protein